MKGLFRPANIQLQVAEDGEKRLVAEAESFDGEKVWITVPDVKFKSIEVRSEIHPSLFDFPDRRVRRTKLSGTLEFEMEEYSVRREELEEQSTN